MTTPQSTSYSAAEALKTEGPYERSATNLIGKDAIDFATDPRATLGFICLPTDLMSDHDVPTLLSQVPDVRWRLQKLRMDGDDISVKSYRSARDHIFTAAQTLRPENSINVLALACTSLSFTLGVESIEKELQRAHPKAKVTNMATAVTEALSFLGAKRLAVFTPYGFDLAQGNMAILHHAGFEVTSALNLGLQTDNDISLVTQDYIRQSLLKLTEKGTAGAEADTVVIACSAFNVFTKDFIDQLERELGRPVVTSLQSLVWHMLRLAEIDDPIYGYGKLLRQPRVVKKQARIKIAKDNDRKKRPAVVDTKDVYPSRQPKRRAELLPRVDPVIDHSSIQAGPLTPEQMLAYERDGAMVLRQVFGAEEVAALREAIVGVRDYYETLPHEEIDNSNAKLITEKAVGGGAGTKTALKSIWEIHKTPGDAPHLLEAAPMLAALARDARLVNVAKQIVGEDVYIHQSRINFQQGYGESNPLGGTGFLWHQDFEQWHSDDGMPRMRAVSMAVLLDRNTEANAALLVMPGTHRYFVQAEAYSDENLTAEQAALRLRTGPILGDHILPGLANKFGIRYCTGEPGDVVIFDCATLHGSHTNISPWPRQNAFFVYNAVSNTLRPEGGYDPQAPKRPEHIASHSKKYMGQPLPAQEQSLAAIEVLSQRK